MLQSCYICANICSVIKSFLCYITIFAFLKIAVEREHMSLIGKLKLITHYGRPSIHICLWNTYRWILHLPTINVYYQFFLSFLWLCLERMLSKWRIVYLKVNSCFYSARFIVFDLSNILQCNSHSSVIVVINCPCPISHWSWRKPFCGHVPLCSVVKQRATLWIVQYWNLQYKALKYKLWKRHLCSIVLNTLVFLLCRVIMSLCLITEYLSRNMEGTAKFVKKRLDEKNCKSRCKRGIR